MVDKISYEQLLKMLESKKSGDHEWFLSLLDDEFQRQYEDEHIFAVMRMLRIARIRAHKNNIKAIIFDNNLQAVYTNSAKEIME